MSFHEHYCPVVIKWDHPNTEKLSVFKIGVCSDPYLWSWILGLWL